MSVIWCTATEGDVRSEGMGVMGAAAMVEFSFKVDPAMIKVVM